MPLHYGCGKICEHNDPFMLVTLTKWIPRWVLFVFHHWTNNLPAPGLGLPAWLEDVSKKHEPKTCFRQHLYTWNENNHTLSSLDTSLSNKFLQKKFMISRYIEITQSFDSIGFNKRIFIIFWWGKSNMILIMLFLNQLDFVTKKEARFHSKKR